MLLWQMAWRNIWRNKLRSAVIMLSVCIGLFAGLAVLALQKGMMRSRVRTVIDRELGHLQIHHPSFTKDYYPGFVVADGPVVERKLSSMPAIKAFTCRSVTQGMLSTATGSFGVQINGITLPGEDRVSQIAEKIKEGSLFDSSKKNQVIISRRLAERLQLKLKSKVVLTFTDKENVISAGAFRICGIYQTINTPLDERNVFVQKDDLDTLLGTGHNCHEVSLLLHNDEDLLPVQQEIKNAFPLLLVESWKELSPETELMLTSVNQYMYIIIIIIMLALAFGIINSMLMAILERTREIGMLTALGMSRYRMFRLVLQETVLLTLTGTPLGLLTAWAGIRYFASHGLDISSVSREAMSSFGFESVIYPEFPQEHILKVMAIVAGTALLAALFPAWKALRLRPVQALQK